ncbi:MAG TPA: TMEM165/GDT1 family protein [Thermoanaerobaculia bacterium]
MTAVALQGSTELVVLTYSTVLASELIGDKSIFTIASLAMRFRPVAVACGVAIAFMAKMSAAVLGGHLLAHLPVRWISGLSAATLFATALFIWLRRQETPAAEPTPARGWQRGMSVAFSAIFFAEWADPGQLAAAALAAGSAAPGLVWLAGTLALFTKGGLAMTLGTGLRRRIPDRLARFISVTCCLVLGLVSLSDLLAS